MNARTRPTNEALDDDIPELGSKAKVVGRGLGKDRRLSLRMLREALGKTQAEIARAAEMEQSEVSRIEAREDLKLSTLTKYATALGGKVEIAVTIAGRRYLVAV